MRFLKYPSIENNIKLSYINNLIEEGRLKNDFHIKEKIDGCNLSFICDGKDVKICSRNMILETEEDQINLFCSNVILEQYKQKILAFQKVFGKAEIRIFGEMFGRFFPGTLSKQRGIQKRVFYSPNLEFLAFDFLIDNVYVNIDTARLFFIDYNIPYVKTLFRGTIEQCLEFDYDFDSMIPLSLGHRHLRENQCEGIVISPNETGFFDNGKRVIFKRKNEKFSERIYKPRKEIVFTEEEKDLFSLIKQYITKNRYFSLKSKFGELSMNHFGDYIKEFSLDVYKDLVNDNPNINSFDKKEMSFLRKSINRETVKFLKREMNNENTDI